MIRPTFAAGLSLAWLAAFGGFAPPYLIGDARAQDTKAQDTKAQDSKTQSATAALVAKPMALADMAVGPAKAPVTIVEYASMTCPHCADFGQNVFPMLRSKYIDTGKVRFVFREFPLDIKALGASMLARCIGRDDPEKYLSAIETMFKQQGPLLAQTLDTLNRVGRQAGKDEKAVEACVKDQAMLDRISADQKFANEELNVTVTPTFFVNGEMIKGAMTFEEVDKKIQTLLKR
jgi:protein-disulfide isomerase